METFHNTTHGNIYKTLTVHFIQANIIKDIGRIQINNITDEHPTETPIPKLQNQTDPSRDPTQALAQTMAQTIIAKSKNFTWTLPMAQTQEEIDQATIQVIQKETTIPTDIPIKENIDKKGLMWPHTFATIHQAAPKKCRVAQETADQAGQKSR